MNGCMYNIKNMSLINTNSIDAVEEDSLQEGIIEQRSVLSYKDSEKKLVQSVDEWINEAKPLHNQFLSKQQKNERYYLGDQLDFKKLSKYKAKIILNKVWQSLETVIPRATKKLPAPTASLPVEEDNPKQIDNTKYTRNLEDILLSMAEELNLGQKFKEIIRYQQLYYLGVLKFGYDETEGIWIECIRPQRILIPPKNSLDYVMEYHQDTVSSIKRKFAGMLSEEEKKEMEIKINEAVKSNGVLVPDASLVGYWEVTLPEFKFWKLNNIILKKIRNPHYNFKNEKKNHWKEPLMDYVFSDLWTLGINKYSQTTLVEQIITLQDSINKRKRQISDNADKAQGTLVAYGAAGATKKETSALQANRDNPDGVTYFADANQGAVAHFGGQLLQPYVLDDMYHTINEVDNVFGTHSTTRGEKTPGEETFGGRQLLKESDQERIDELTQMLERMAEKIYNAFAQMIRVHFEKKQYVSYLGQDGTSVQMQVDKNIIKDGVKIRVKEGSSLVKDKVTLSSEAILLWQNKAIDPITLYERIGDPQPYKTAERFFLWNTSPETLFKQITADLEKTTQSDRQKSVLEAIAQAEIENRVLVRGEKVPPYSRANEQHIATHQDAFSPEIMQQLPPETRENIAVHLEGELEIVKGGLEERKKKESQPNLKEMLDSRK